MHLFLDVFWREPARGILLLGPELSRIGFSIGNDYPLHLGPWMLGGFVPLFLGLVLLHFLTQKD